MIACYDAVLCEVKIDVVVGRENGEGGGKFLSMSVCIRSWDKTGIQQKEV